MSLSGWHYEKPLTISSSKVSSNVSNFHYLVYLDSSNFDFSKARSDGHDIRFTDSSGTTLLNYFREKHDSTNQVAIYHVKIPLVSSSQDTTIYMYYGNTAASDGSTTYANVFNNQVAYYPFDGNANDLSGNYNGTWNGTAQYDTGVMGQAAKFDGSSGVDRDYNAMLGNTSNPNVLISFWIKAYTYSTRYDAFCIGGDTGTGNSIKVYLNKTNNNTLYVGYFETGSNLENQAMTTTNWNNIVIESVNDNKKVYINGSLIHTTTGTSNISPHNIKLGMIASHGLDGLIDQVRIYNTALSSTQVSLLYKMENKTLFTFGAEEKVSTGNTLWFAFNF